MRVPLLLTSLSIVLACARPSYVESWPDRFRFMGGAQPGFGIKQVIEKQRPITLVADDGSVCRTSRERYSRTKEMALVACVWNLPSMDSTSTSQHTSRAGTWTQNQD